MDLDDLRGWIQAAVTDVGHTLDSLNAHMGIDRSYINKVLSGDKPLNLAFLLGLPADVAARVAASHAEHFGHVVVAPVSGQAAVQHLVSGLVGLLVQAALPVKAARPLKAGIESRERKTA